MARVIGKFGFLFLLMLLSLSTRDASAVLVSSYHDGFAYYNQDGLYGRVDFAVYDTQDSVYGDEYKDNGIEMPGTGRYIYAYQIFNDLLFSQEAVSYFAIVDAQGELIEESAMNGTCGQDDGQDGVEPSPIVSDRQGAWTWTLDGAGYVSQGEHSWLLVFSSDQPWEKGTFEIQSPETGGVPVPVPEPATLIILALGGTVVLAGRRKSG
jgi:hypothetical protein